MDGIVSRDVVMHSKVKKLKLPSVYNKKVNYWNLKFNSRSYCFGLRAFRVILSFKLKTHYFSLQVIAPQFKHFQKLRDFVEMKLPPGFPVKIDLPIFPTISARITFHDFKWKNGTGWKLLCYRKVFKGCKRKSFRPFNDRCDKRKSRAPLKNV